MTDDGPVTRHGDGPPGGPLFAGPADDPDRYELTGPGIGGGEGVTWGARYQGRLRTPLRLAVKMLRRPPSAGADWPTAEDRQRWRDQAALLRHVRSAHLTTLHDVFTGPPPHGAGAADPTQTDVTYLEMEWVDGPTLHESVYGRPVTARTLPERLGWVAQAAGAMAELQSVTRTGGNPALHRDIKPTNCILNPERGLVLVDVSTLRPVDDGADPLGRHTPPYTAPEVLQAPRDPRDARADVYSLGALAYFCLTGTDPPVAGFGDAVGAEAVAAVRAAGVRNAEAVVRHLASALAADPAQRPTDVRQWARRLGDLAGPNDRRSSATDPVRFRVLAAVAVLVVALLVVAVARPGWLPQRSEQQVSATGAPRTVPATGATATTASTTGAAPSGSRCVILSPPPGTKVKMCSYLSGTATISPGHTLVLAMSNLDNGDPTSVHRGRLRLAAPEDDVVLARSAVLWRRRQRRPALPGRAAGRRPWGGPPRQPSQEPQHAGGDRCRPGQRGRRPDRGNGRRRLRRPLLRVRG